MHCFHTFSAVSLLDMVAKFLQAGEQCGTAFREEDRCLLRFPTAAVRTTHVAFQRSTGHMQLWGEPVAIVMLRQSTHRGQSLDSTCHIVYFRVHVQVLTVCCSVCCSV